MIGGRSGLTTAMLHAMCRPSGTNEGEARLAWTALQLWQVALRCMHVEDV